MYFILALYVASASPEDDLRAAHAHHTGRPLVASIISRYRLSHERALMSEILPSLLLARRPLSATTRRAGDVLTMIGATPAMSRRYADVEAAESLRVNFDASADRPIMNARPPPASSAY